MKFKKKKTNLEKAKAQIVGQLNHSENDHTSPI